jgi:hypothetical protein
MRIRNHHRSGPCDHQHLQRLYLAGAPWWVDLLGQRTMARRAWPAPRRKQRRVDTLSIKRRPWRPSARHPTVQPHSRPATIITSTNAASFHRGGPQFLHGYGLRISRADLLRKWDAPDGISFSSTGVLSATLANETSTKTGRPMSLPLRLAMESASWRPRPSSSWCSANDAHVRAPLEPRKRAVRIVPVHLRVREAPRPA